MSRAGLRPWLVALLALIYLVHNDLWFWDDPRIVLGLPIGLTYHVVYCLSVSVVLLLLVRSRWNGTDSEGKARP